MTTCREPSIRLSRELMAQLPAIAITGPRAIGKTTTARRHVRTVVRLDREAEAAAFRADPDVALKSQVEPILLDEWREGSRASWERSNARLTTTHARAGSS